MIRWMVAGLLGGLAGGVATSVAMKGGRHAGLLHDTLDRRGEDWLDRMAGARGRLGEAGTTLLEQSGHGMASLAFGAGYGALRAQLPHGSPALLGAAYGAGLYAVGIAGIAPRLGITEGERRAGPALAAQRLGMHVLFGLATALVAEAAHARLSASGR
ncbi:hypothetical protein [Teichococcus aestuarii]|uniref:hypothetical protein n=1 Tax=Teichococcus aestuarii TaxID=568898 RepID=UPI00360B4826